MPAKKAAKKVAKKAAPKKKPSKRPPKGGGGTDTKAKPSGG